MKAIADTDEETVERKRCESVLNLIVVTENKA
jgi:hypothetical protein